MPENLRFDLLTVREMSGVNRISCAATPSCGATVTIRSTSEREGDPIPQGIERSEPRKRLHLCSCRDHNRIGSERRDSGAGRGVCRVSCVSCGYGRATEQSGTRARIPERGVINKRVRTSDLGRS